MGSWRGVGPGQGGAYAAAGTGNENEARIPHPGIIPQNMRSVANRDDSAKSLVAAPYLSGLRQLDLTMLAALPSPVC
jgi:hypothetical protein